MARGGNRITSFNAFAALRQVDCKNCHADGGPIGRGGNMSPTEVITRAAQDGVLIALSLSGGISATGGQSAVDRWLPAIRQNKAAILGLLQPGEDGWSTQDWRAFF